MMLKRLLFGASALAILIPTASAQEFIFRYRPGVLNMSSSEISPSPTEEEEDDIESDFELSDFTTTLTEGDLVTEDHERLTELLAYANLPVWAKDKTAFRKRWGQTAADHTFEALFAPTARHQQVVRFEKFKRRAA